MNIIKLQEFGDCIAAVLDNGDKILAYPTGGSMWVFRNNTRNLKLISKFQDQLVVRTDDDKLFTAYRGTGTNLYFIKGELVAEPKLVDTISPGHSVTNPGGTVAAGWQWHLDNNGLRGGVDWNYDFQNIKAPGKGTVSHFDVSGVGMVIRLVLDTPAVRKDPQLDNDEFGPMTAIWFQHCSDANDGAVDIDDIIGVSGDGYGAYGAHLHVHGMINNGSSAPEGTRCNFWGFV